jgi:hypothetical protein
MSRISTTKEEGMLHEDTRQLRGEGRLTDEVLREKMRQGRGPIFDWGHHGPKTPPSKRPGARAR